MVLSTSPRSRHSESFSFIDLFAGIGGFRAGLESVGGTCVFSSEIDRWARETYQANFGSHEVAGDISTIESRQIPAHDVLAAGFPCQPFSIAGVSKKNSLGRPHGFEDQTQGTLFFDVARIIRDLRPKAFILENVKNLLSHDRRRTFEVIRRTLVEELRYKVTWSVIDARRFLPQHRERIFIVGIREDLGVDFSWDYLALPPLQSMPTLALALHPEDGSEGVDSRYLDSSGRVLSKYVLTDRLWSYLQGHANKHRALGNGFGYGLVSRDSVARTLSARYFKDGSEILVRRPSGPPRRLTPLECARLMGFVPLLGSEETRRFRIVVSDNQAYKQFGNAVAVPVVSAISKALLETLRERS